MRIDQLFILKFVLVLFIIRATIACIRLCKERMLPTLYVYPLWGIGNRLRTVRVCYNIAQQSGHAIVIVDHIDEGFDHPSLTALAGLPFRHISEKSFKRMNLPTLGYNEECTLRVSRENLDIFANRSFCIKACEIDIIGETHLNESNTLYKHVKFNLPFEYHSMFASIRNNPKVIGVHIRQGSVNDWSRGYFFGDEWKDIKIKKPETSPQFCCFDDASKNLSACASNVVAVDKYINRMKQFASDTIFFICADRTGCLLYLHQLFPGRVIMLPLSLETEKVSSQRGMADFYGLSLCSTILISRLSSFSNEASRVNNSRLIYLET
jgi:hypothetical protein